VKTSLQALKPHLDVVIVGEDDNKQAIYTLLIGSKFADLDKKQIIILKGTEGGGKTTIASTLTGFFKTKTVGRFTEHALEYSDIKGYEVLYIKELGQHGHGQARRCLNQVSKRRRQGLHC
jgi:energy-coupling factor transporter ATP-binding protein EcfA2